MTTIRELHRQAHSLSLYCADCDCWRDADLARLICQGYGERVIVDTQFRCRRCGARAEKQVRPPVPAVSSASAYIACGNP